MVMVRVLVPPAGIEAGEKVLVNEKAWTFKLAVAGEALVTPCRVWMEPIPAGPAGIVLIYAPCTAEMTLAVIVQVLRGPIWALFRATDVAPGMAVTVPAPQSAFFVGLAGFARTRFVGK
jgi:hypothetical protein